MVPVTHDITGITQRQVLDKAIAGCETACYIALEIRERLEGVTSIAVSAKRVRFNLNGERHEYQPDDNAAKVIAGFDVMGSLLPEGIPWALAYKGSTPVKLRGSRATNGLAPKKSAPVSKPGQGKSRLRRYHAVLETQ